MKALFPSRKVSRILFQTAPLILCVPFFVGCETQGYDPDLDYGLRTDPILVEVPNKEPRLPDRPGQFPLLSLHAFHDLNLASADKEREENEPLYALGKYYQDNAAKILDPNDPKKLPSKLRSQVESRLKLLFGTPAKPHVGSSGDVMQSLANDGNKNIPLAAFKESLKLDEKTLAAGSKLYRIHCLHCHGLTGDGRGPTAPWVNPHPRDYRGGVFKYVSSNQPQGVQKPRRADILRVLREGIDGTSMPAFNVLTDEEREHLASYVVHLSLRGQTELRLLSAILPTGKLDEEVGSDVPDAAKKILEELGGQWFDASLPKSELMPEPYPAELLEDKTKTGKEKEEAEKVREAKMRESIQRGYNFFTDAKDGCFKCHVDYGRQSTFRFDSWGTLSRPRDLTQGTYRGGRRPLDLYWRVSLGINSGSGVGATMSPFRDVLKGKGSNKYDAGVWDVVNFVQILPYPGMRAKYDFIKGVD